MGSLSDPDYGDLGGAWTPSNFGDQRDWVALEFDNNGPIDSILIWETYNPGYIDTVYVQNPNTGSWVNVYTHTAAMLPDVSRILRIGFPTTSFNVNRVRIAISNDIAAGYPEIDAVAIHPASNPVPALSNVIGTALALDGVNDVYQTNTPLQTLMEGSFTWMAWVKPLGSAPSVSYGEYGACIACDSYDAVAGITVGNQAMGAVDSIYMWSYGTPNGSVAMPYTAGAWIHLTMVHTADSIIGYRDGVRVKAAAAGAPIVEPYSLDFGPNYDNSLYFEGEIDEFKTFNRALDAVEVANQVHLIGFPALTTGLTGYWQFNEGAGIGHYNPYNHITDSLLNGAAYVAGGYAVGTTNPAESLLEVFPNPTLGELFVKDDLQGATLATLTDLSGQVMIQQKWQPKQGAWKLDLSDLPAGMYLLHLHGKSISQSVKVVRQ
ncbi:MAG: hypothetical protein RLZZ519_1505 [Bacteroidota bacterium]|jgi:hypothetical protein